MKPERSMAVTFSIKNVPDELAEKIRRRARRHHRSLQGELLAILEQAADPHVMTVAQLADRVAAMGLVTGDEASAIVRGDRDGRSKGG